MHHLFDHLSEVEEKIRKSNLALFLDYDGTLVPFKDNPEDAVPTDALIKTLRELSKRFFVSIVSGRMLKDLKSMLNIGGLSFVGLHGMEIEDNGEYFIWEGAKNVKPILNMVKDEIFSNFNKDGIYIEDKGFTLALHYRSFKGDTGVIKDKFDEILREHKELEVVQGSKVLEVRPKGWNKGKAVKMLLKDKMFPIYIGDDTTDEDAFIYLKDTGITVLVSDKERDTNAKFYLRNQNEVILFLNWMLKL